MSRLRLLLIGIDHPHGAHWRELLGNVSDQLEVAAVVPGFGGSIASLEERFADLPRFESVEQSLAQTTFDAAFVCLPNAEAPTVVTQLARAGKHVLAEKPVAMSADAARKMVAEIERTGIAFQNGYMWRYDLAAERLRSMVLEGRFGHLISIEMTYVTSDVARRGPDHYLFSAQASGGGYFSWLACHYLDLLLYLTGQSVVGVTARTGVFGSTKCEVDDGGVAILDLSGGALATIIGGYWVPRWAGETRWCIRGDQRWVHWDPSRKGTGGVLEIHGPQPQWHAMEETFTLPEDPVKGYGGSRGVRLVQDWIDAIRSGRPCRNTAQSTMSTLELIDAIYQSSREGRRVVCNVGG